MLRPAQDGGGPLSPAPARVEGPSRDLIVLGGPRWSDEVNQSSVQMVRQLCRRHRVLYVHRDLQGSALRTLVDPREAGDRRHVLAHMLGRTAVRQAGERLWIAPLRGLAAALPLSYPGLARRASLALMARFLRGACRSLGFEQPVLWFYWWFYPELADALSCSASVYDCVDAHALYPHNRRLARMGEAERTLERMLLKRVDLFFAVNDRLLSERAPFVRRAVLAPNGLDLEVVDAALARPGVMPDVAGLRRPLIGYVGNVGPRVDWDLIRVLAARHRDWTFAFVGGVRPAEAPSLPNVQVLPSRPYQDVLRTIRHFDVAMIPLADTAFNQGTSPLKLLDAMVVGRPIVARPLPAVRGVAAAAPGLFFTASTADEWSAALQAALAERPDSPLVEARRAVARARSSERRCEAMMARVEEILNPRPLPAAADAAAGGPGPVGPRDVIVLGGPAWSEGINQPTVHVVRELVRDHRVLYVYRAIQGSVLRSLVEPREPGDRRRALGLVFGRSTARQVGDRLWVAPLRGLAAVLPLSYPEPARRLSLALVRRLIERSAARIGFRSPALWFYWWFYPELAESGLASVTVYDCIDDHLAYHYNARMRGLQAASRRLEARLLGDVDVAFFVSPRLREARGPGTSRPFLCPNGVDTAVAEAALGQRALAPDVAALPRPLIGYVGDVGPRVDWKLVAALAARHPAWTFAFVGGPRPAEAPALPNVRVLPGRSYQEVLRTVRRFDVAVLPLADSEFNRGTSPLKLLDYLIVGKPIVARPLPSVAALAAESPGAIRMAATPDEWSEALAGALAEAADSPLADLRRATARRHSAAGRCASMLARIEEVCASRATPSPPHGTGDLGPREVPA